jgi:hypothetical protein
MDGVAESCCYHLDPQSLDLAQPVALSEPIGTGVGASDPCSRGTGTGGRPPAGRYTSARPTDAGVGVGGGTSPPPRPTASGKDPWTSPIESGAASRALSLVRQSDNEIHPGE